jgi:hypothetical protein
MVLAIRWYHAGLVLLCFETRSGHVSSTPCQLLHLLNVVDNSLLSSTLFHSFSIPTPRIHIRSLGQVRNLHFDCGIIYAVSSNNRPAHEPLVMVGLWAHVFWELASKCFSPLGTKGPVFLAMYWAWVGRDVGVFARSGLDGLDGLNFKDLLCRHIQLCAPFRPQQQSRSRHLALV